MALDAKKTWALLKIYLFGVFGITIGFKVSNTVLGITIGGLALKTSFSLKYITVGGLTNRLCIAEKYIITKVVDNIRNETKREVRDVLNVEAREIIFLWF